METYEISKSKVISITDKSIFQELQGHCPLNQTYLKFGETFYVKIDLYTDSGRTDNTNGIQYFHNLTDEKPFLEMGYSATGFIVGTKI